MRRAKRYYEDQTRTFETGVITDEHKRIASVITTIAGTSGGSAKVLELGCGSGAVAAVLADRGWAVTAIDFNAPAIAMARAFAESRLGRLVPVEGDVYTVDLPGPYDLVFYWDGFGVGEDEDQVQLLSRVKGWLAPGGRAVVDVFSPYFWMAKHGTSVVYQATNGETWERRIEFDFRACRLVDHWTNLDDPTVAPRSQSLRCYAPADISRLVSEAGLRLIELFTSDGARIIGNDVEAIRDRTSFLLLLE